MKKHMKAYVIAGISLVLAAAAGFGLPGLLLHATAPGTGETDCVSRTFAPKLCVDEDPVCGSGHCHIVPYWADRLGKKELTAYQASSRGGTLYCCMEGDRVRLAGHAALFSQGEILTEP